MCLVKRRVSLLLLHTAASGYASAASAGIVGAENDAAAARLRLLGLLLRHLASSWPDDVGLWATESSSRCCWVLAMISETLIELGNEGRSRIAQYSWMPRPSLRLRPEWLPYAQATPVDVYTLAHSTRVSFGESGSAALAAFAQGKPTSSAGVSFTPFPSIDPPPRWCPSWGLQESNPCLDVRTSRPAHLHCAFAPGSLCELTNQATRPTKWWCWCDAATSVPPPWQGLPRAVLACHEN